MHPKAVSRGLALGAEGISGNGWQVNLTGAWQVSQYSVQTLTFPALVTNHGSKLEFIFLGQPIPGIVAKETYNHERDPESDKSLERQVRGRSRGMRSRG